MTYPRHHTCLALSVGLNAICAGRIGQVLISIVLSLSTVVLACTVPPGGGYGEVLYS